MMMNDIVIEFKSGDNEYFMKNGYINDYRLYHLSEII